MTRFRNIFVIALLSLGFVLGCERAMQPTEPNESLIASGLRRSIGNPEVDAAPTSVVLANGYTVNFLGTEDVSLADGTPGTKFKYSVVRPPLAPGSDTHFRLELAPQGLNYSAVEPSNGNTTNNDENFNPGVEWHPSSGPSEFFFSITYNRRNIPIGRLKTSVKSGSTNPVGMIAGPFGRVTISGTVYTDAGNPGVFDPSELGVDSATINLSRGSTVVASTISDRDGRFAFTVFADSYTLALDATTIPSLNYEYLDFTEPTLPTPGQYDLDLLEDVTRNFGLLVKRANIIRDLTSGTLQTTGKTVTWWKGQFAAAVNNRTKNISPSDLAILLRDKITPFGFQPPYVFVLSNQANLQSALDSLSKPTRSPTEKLLAQLLTAELNYFQGYGLTTNRALQEVLMEWGESLLQPTPTTALIYRKGAEEIDGGDPAAIDDAVTIFEGINKSTGGGGQTTQ